MRAIPWFLAVAVGCTTMSGQRWDATAGCWREGPAFTTFDRSCDDVEILVESPRGECWALSCWPDLPRGWEVASETCADAPQAEIDAFSEDRDRMTICG